MHSLQKGLKSTFRVDRRHEAIFTGGIVQLCEEGDRLICVSHEATRLVDLAKSQSVRSWDNDDIVTALAIAPDSSVFVVYLRNLLVKAYSLTSYENIRSWKLHDLPVQDATFDASSTLVASGSSDRTVKVYDLQQGFLTHNFKGHEAVIVKVKFCTIASDILLASASEDGVVTLWSLKKKQSVGKFSAHMSVPTSLAFTKCGKYLLTAGRDRVVNKINTTKNTLEETFITYEAVEALSIVQSENDKTLENCSYVTAGEKGQLKSWKLSNGAPLVSSNYKNETRPFVGMIRKGTDNQLIVITNDQNLIFFDDRTLEKQKVFIGYNDQIIDLKFLGDENRVVAATNSEQIRFFNTQTWHCDVIEGHKDICLSVDVSFDKTLVCSGSKDNTVRLWDVEALECIGVGEGHIASISAVAFSKKAKTFFLSGGEDKTIKLWNTSDAIKQGSNRKEVALTPTKTILAHDKDVNSISVAPNDRLFATGSQDKTCKIWSLPDMSLKGTLKGHKRGIWCVEFSPVDQVIATGSGDQTIKIWSVKDYTCLMTFEGHLNSVLRVSFITKGMQLVSSGSDGLLKLWTIKTNECVETFDSHTDKIWALAVHSDENIIVSGGGDSILNVWKDVTKEVEEEKIATQEKIILKEQEIQNFLFLREYKNALILAFELEQPSRIYRILETLVESNSSTEMAEVLKSLPEKELGACVAYMRDWNTSGKQSFVTQKVLNILLTSIHIDKLKKIPQITEIVDAMIPYTQRHMQRVNSLVQRSYLLDFTLQSMRNLGPQESDVVAIDMAERKSSAPIFVRKQKKTKNKPPKKKPETESALLAESKGSETGAESGVLSLAGLIKPTKEAKLPKFPYVDPLGGLGLSGNTGTQGRNGSKSAGKSGGGDDDDDDDAAFVLGESGKAKGAKNAPSDDEADEKPRKRKRKGLVVRE